MAKTEIDCLASFALLANGSIEYLVNGWIPYPYVLTGLAFLMGLGKGGVPGSSTTSVALNSLFAPTGLGCLDSSVALGVPVTFMSDCMVVVNYYHLARWDVIWRLLPPTTAGVVVGTQLMGRLSDSGARLLVGAILLLILSVNLAQSLLLAKPAGGDGRLPAYAESLWFAWVVGVVGGFATILTNSMGPMLNVYLLTLGLSPTTFVGTRATFFSVINTLKLAQRLYAGTLSAAMLRTSVTYGLVGLCGVWLSTRIIPYISKRLFTRLEYGLMTFAALKLIDAGLQTGFLG